MAAGALAPGEVRAGEFIARPQTTVTIEGPPKEPPKVMQKGDKDG